MHPLVNELAAAGEFGIGAPFSIVALAPAVSVTTAHEHQRTQLTLIDQFARFLQSGMKAVIVTQTDARTGALGDGFDSPQLRRVQAAGFFDEHVFACRYSRQGDGSERRV